MSDFQQLIRTKSLTHNTNNSTKHLHQGLSIGGGAVFKERSSSLFKVSMKVDDVVPVFNHLQVRALFMATQRDFLQNRVSAPEKVVKQSDLLATEQNQQQFKIRKEMIQASL